MHPYKSRPLLTIVGFYLICCVLRAGEYFWLRTDQSIFGEAFIHKLMGILLLAGALRLLPYRWRDIGLGLKHASRQVGLGLLLGCGVFIVAYGAEIIVQTAAGNAPFLRFYVTSYALQGNRGMQSGAFFILMCLAGNIINVVMEEGVFRGLFVRLAEEKYAFAIASGFSSLLFGIWHIAQPVRNVLDGQQSPMGAMISGLLLVITSALLGLQCCMLLRVTGSLWMGMAAHFTNNAAINLLHVLTASGADEMQTVRITIAQTLSFIMVLILFLRHRRRTEARL